MICQDEIWSISDFTYTEENERSKAKMLHHGRRDLADNEIVHPVRRCCDGKTLATNGQRPDFGDQDPCTRSPRVTESHRENPDEGACSPTSILVPYALSATVKGRRNKIKTYSGHESRNFAVRIATMIWQAAMMNAPEVRIGRRPALSTQITAGMVARNILSGRVRCNFRPITVLLTQFQRHRWPAATQCYPSNQES